ncbi:hypothetical protein M0R45_020980 [Rubus argutus]|uniref:Uncharacterized protein n=1 Tax=Rubus argutus TaxID=59490 RepID=A0AAW1XBQ8_RUBAR
MKRVSLAASQSRFHKLTGAPTTAEPSFTCKHKNSQQINPTLPLLGFHLGKPDTTCAQLSPRSLSAPEPVLASKPSSAFPDLNDVGVVFTATDPLLSHLDADKPRPRRLVYAQPTPSPARISSQQRRTSAAPPSSIPSTPLPPSPCRQALRRSL